MAGLSRAHKKSSRNVKKNRLIWQIFSLRKCFMGYGLDQIEFGQEVFFKNASSWRATNWVMESFFFFLFYNTRQFVVQETKHEVMSFHYDSCTVVFLHSVQLPAASWLCRPGLCRFYIKCALNVCKHICLSKCCSKENTTQISDLW